MTIIKARETAGQVSGFRFLRPTAPNLQDRARAEEFAAPLAPEEVSDGVALASGRIEALQHALKAKEVEAAALREAALEEGRQLGRAEATDRQADRLKALEQSLSEAGAAVQEKLAEHEEQAIIIAKAALARILGDQSQFAGLVAETVGLWRHRLENTTILRVIVSPLDFSSEGDLASLQLRLGNLDITTAPKFASGECRFVLAMGEVDLSLPRQAAAVERMLAAHASESVAA